MENQEQSLNDYALFCECAERAAKFGILTDFVKKGVVEFYTKKSKNQFLASDEVKILKDKYSELQSFLDEMLDIEDESIRNV